MTSDPVLVDAHFTSGLFSLVSVSSLFPFFLCFWIFKPCDTVGYLPLQTFNILLLAQLYITKASTLFDISRYYQGIHDITFSYIVSCFCLPWFDSKIPDILRYQDGHPKLDVLPYLSSHCLLPPLWHESETCFADMLCCFNDFSSYWPTTSLEKRGSLTRTISSSMKFVRSINPGSHIWVFLIFFTFLFHLSYKYARVFAKIIQMTSSANDIKWHPLDDSDYHTPNFGTLLGS